MNGSPTSLWDEGAQNERTALAWTRTALALLTAGLIVSRFAQLREPALGLIVAITVVVLAAWVLVLSMRRYRYSERRLRDDLVLPDGVLPLAMCLLTVVIGLTGAWLILATR